MVCPLVLSWIHATMWPGLHNGSKCKPASKSEYMFLPPSRCSKKKHKLGHTTSKSGAHRCAMRAWTNFSVQMGRCCVQSMCVAIAILGAIGRRGGLTSCCLLDSAAGAARPAYQSGALIKAWHTGKYRRTLTVTHTHTHMHTQFDANTQDYNLR